MYNNDYYSRDDRLNTIYGSPHTVAPQMSKKKKVLTLTGLIILVALVSVASCAAYLAAMGYFSSSGSSQNFKVNQVNTADASAVTTSTSGSLTTPQIIQKIRPAVVGIKTTTTMTSGGGSGIIFSDDGYIVTNYHVINGAQTITVTLNDESEYEATVVGADEKTDLAVIKINAKGLTAAEIGDSDALVQGETALVIGNPLGETLSGSISQGIISALGREIQVGGRTMHYLQTDAAINPGNSGGPLVNSNGLVVGIASAKINSAIAEGLGFAIPINEAVPVIEELINNGYVSGRPLIGISGENVTEQVSMFYNLPQGVYVRYVDPESGAYKAGIQAGDIITSINGTAISTMSELNNQRDNFNAGDTVTLSVYRGSQTMEIKVVLGDANTESDTNQTK